MAAMSWMVLSLNLLDLPELLLRSFGFTLESHMSAVALNLTTSAAHKAGLNNIGRNARHKRYFIAVKPS
jgi:hypothetical protein